MIIFKASINKQILINDTKIVCLEKAKKYDFEIVGSILNENVLIDICLKTIYINPDKRYILKFENIDVIPCNSVLTNSDYGILDMINDKIIKPFVYKEKKVVSFSLYGNKPMYCEGAIRNLKQYTEKYKDISCYFYVRNDVNKETIDKIKDAGGIVIECIDNENWYGMFTRFLPCENEKELYLSRDCDCRLINREVKAIEQWLATDKKFHIIRDHPWHNTLILGGMWGIKNMCIENLRFQIMYWCLEYIKLNEKKEKGPDQYFLKNLYRLVKNDIYVNDEFFEYETEKYKINIERINKEYIGEAYDANDNYDIYLRNKINT